MTEYLPTIAVLGGTGAEGSGLAMRWAQAGYRVLIGSRSAEKAAEFAAEIGAEGMGNAEAAAGCDIAVLTVPYSAQRPTLSDLKDALQGKILVDVTVPLVPPKVMRVQLPEEGSAAQIAQTVLGDSVRVVSAFQNVSAGHLKDPDHLIDCDVLITGDDPDAREEVVRLATAAGLTAIEAGPLDNAVAAEALTSLLIWINRKYKSPGAGIRITALPHDPAI
ncbi:MAG: NADPH-dependent F420 reductase [Pseudomonadota bacterium]|nr:NADPH-dependent F420 reductase [Pseudomonadota bacterium]